MAAMGACAVEAMEPLAVRDEHRVGAADEKAALDHPDDASDAVLQPRRVGDGAGEAAVENAIAAVGDEQLTRRRQAWPDICGEHVEGRSGDFQPESNDLDRHRRVCPQPIDQLGAIDDDGEAPACVGDDLLAQQGAA